MLDRTGWTIEREEHLRRLHAAGWSFSQIAEMLGGGLTRNAVAGKTDRMALPARGPRSCAPSVPRPRAHEPDPANRVAFAELHAQHCRFPYGDPGHPDFLFCGSPKQRGPYCEHHARIAYQPPRDRNR